MTTTTTNSHSEAGHIARSERVAGVEADVSSTEGLLILRGLLEGGGGVGRRIFALQRVEFKINSAEKEMNHFFFLKCAKFIDFSKDVCMGKKKTTCLIYLKKE